jgi:hypothetical protein
MKKMVKVISYMIQGDLCITLIFKAALYLGLFNSHLCPSRAIPAAVSGRLWQRHCRWGRKARRSRVQLAHVAWVRAAA